MKRALRLVVGLMAALTLLGGGPALAGEASRFEAIGPWRLVCDRLGQMAAGSRTETCRAGARKGSVALWVLRDPWSIWIDLDVTGCTGAFNVNIPVRALSYDPDLRTQQVAAQFARMERNARARCRSLPDLGPILRSADLGRMLTRSDGLRSMLPGDTHRH